MVILGDGSLLEYVNPKKYSIPTKQENGSLPSDLGDFTDLAEMLVFKN